MFELSANYIDTKQGYTKAYCTLENTCSDNLHTIYSEEEIESLYKKKDIQGPYTNYTRYCQLLIEIKVDDTISMIIYDFKDNDTYFECEYNKLIALGDKESAGKLLLNYCRIIKDHVLYADINVKDALPASNFFISSANSNFFGDISLS